VAFQNLNHAVFRRAVYYLLRKAETGNVTPAKLVLDPDRGAGVYGEKTGFLLPAFAGTSFAGMTNAVSTTGII